MKPSDRLTDEFCQVWSDAWDAQNLAGWNSEAAKKAAANPKPGQSREEAWFEARNKTRAELRAKVRAIREEGRVLR